VAIAKTLATLSLLVAAGLANAASCLDLAGECTKENEFDEKEVCYA
jgi:hypothetical protein